MHCATSCGRKATPVSRLCHLCRERREFRDADWLRYAKPNVRLTPRQRKRRRRRNAERRADEFAV